MCLQRICKEVDPPPSPKKPKLAVDTGAAIAPIYSPPYSIIRGDGEQG